MKGMILARYVGLIRGERFAPARPYTDERMMRDIEAVFGGGEPEKIVLEWDEETGLRDMMVKRYGEKGGVRFDESKMFSKPTTLQNRLCSLQLGRYFGKEALTVLDEFDTNGVFRLPDGHGFFVPQWDGREVTELRFVRFSELRKK